MAYSFNFNRWSITGVKVTSERTAVIGLFIPGVNTRDRINVRLNLWDLLRGRTIEEKTIATLDRWEAKCKAMNDENERFSEIGKRIMSRRPPGQNDL